jgi:thiamine biosynthesis lipoprotein
MRLVLGAGGLAAFSALITAIVAPPRPVVLTADLAPQAVTDPGTTTAQAQRPVQYIQLAPGQTAPPGATVIDATAPQPVTVVTKVTAPKPNDTVGQGDQVISERPVRADERRRPGVSQVRTRARAGTRAFVRVVTAAPSPIVPVSHFAASMGGRLTIHLDADSFGRVAGIDPQRARAEAERTSRRTAERIERWAARLTRHSDGSELSRLNADLRAEVAIGPTLAGALRAGRLAAEATEGLADITLLGARLAAEGFEEPGAVSHARQWSLAFGRRGDAVVRRPRGLRFDLGGVGKGWLADRALDALSGWPSAVVDADGDMAVRCAPGKYWEVAVDDPRTPEASLAILRLAASGDAPARWGVATSGISVHRWSTNGQLRHHLIDPRTGRPAVTDVIQATVVAGTALRAEALAKAAVIAGSVAGFALLDRSGVRGAVLLTERGETFALPQTLSLLAD